MQNVLLVLLRCPNLNEEGRPEEDEDECCAEDCHTSALHVRCTSRKKSTTATRVAYVTSLLSVPHRPQRTAENCGKEAAIAVRCQRKKEERAAKRAEEKDANKPQTKETRHSRHTVTRN